MSTKRRTAGETAWRWLLALLALGAVLGWTVYFVPVAWLQNAVVLVDHNGSTSLLRLPLVHLLRRLCLAGGFAFLLLLAVTRWRKAFFVTCLDLAVDDTRSYFRDVASEFRALVATPHRSKLIILGLVIAAGFVLRAVSLGGSVRFDEAYSFNVHASTPFLNLISDYTTPNNHVFHSVLMRCGFLLFGDSPLAIRLPAFLAGLLVIPAAFWSLRRTLGDDAALFAAGLTASSPALIAYSASGRGYTLLTLLLLLAFSVGARLRDRRNVFAWALFVVLLTLGFFTVPVMLYGACALGVWLLLSSTGGRRRAIFWELSAAAAAVSVLTCLLYAPIAVRVGVDALVANRFVSPLPNDVFLDNLPAFVAGLARYWAPATGLLVVLLAGLAVSFFAPALRGREPRSLHFSVLLSVPAIVVLQRVLPYERVFLAFLPLYYGLAAAGLCVVFERFADRMGRTGKRLAVAAAFLAVLAAGIDSTLERRGQGRVFDDLPAVGVKLKAEMRQGDIILASIPLNEPLRLHARRLGLDTRSVRDISEVRAAVAGGSDATFYVVEEKDPPRRQFLTFSVGSFTVSHPFLREYFTQPESIGETNFIRLYRLHVRKPN
ncbi:MAG: glycosyltransferase family 39 protein [Acidobacteria bacterium]|nr:glycosyltransferase family 39 protein [Acidobacteriota bacterium]